jgi:methionine-rich copper-binding protein CopC
MRMTKRRNTSDRRIIGRLQPSFDRLEARTVMSGSSIDTGFFGGTSQFDLSTPTSPLAIASTSPANSASLTSSPNSLTVTFNKPLNGFSVGIADFELVHVNSDGSTSPVASSETQLIESLDFTNPLGDQIDLSLSRPLAEGHYQLILLGSSQLTGTDGSLVTDNGQDQVISDFTIAPEESGLLGSTDLGTIGATVDQSTGDLNLSGDPGAVNYYQLTLASGHRWSLGLAVQSQSLGSSLDTTLSLFDSQGKLIATDSAGLLNDPDDPFLFEGLDPGTYYVGISAQGNVPKADGTYDPTTSYLANQGNGGSYQLQAVAEIADQPTQVLGVRLDQADPLLGSPTGLTLQFSGALQVAGLAYQTEPPLKLVDQNGTSWGVTTVGYDAALGQLQVVFNQALPSGSYTLEMTSPTSLLDLADAEPVAPGLSVGELASFQVGTSVPLPSSDLGPIYPGAGTSSLSSPIVVGAGATVTRQFVVLEAGVYSVEGVSPSSGVSFTLNDSGGTVLGSGPWVSTNGSVDVTLPEGIDTLVLSNPTGQSVEVPLTILHKESVFSQLMDGGIAQGAALSLRLVTPQANFGASTGLTLTTSTGTGASPTPSTLSSTAPGSSQSASSTGSTAGSGLASAAGLASEYLLYGLSPVGLPSTQSNQISVVGSTGMLGNLALASNSAVLAPGLLGIPESSSSGDQAEPSRGFLDDPIDVEAKPEARRVSSTDAGLLARTPQSLRADDQSLAGAEWISRLVANTLGWIEEIGTPSGEPTIAEPLTTNLASSPPVGPLEGDSRVESASLGSPIGVAGVLFAMALRYRKRLFSGRPRRVASSRKGESRQRRLVGPHRVRSQDQVIPWES